jgi:hypothetical protein
MASIMVFLMASPEFSSRYWGYIHQFYPMFGATTCYFRVLEATLAQKKTLSRFSHRPDSGLATGRTRNIGSMYFLWGCEGFDTCLRMGYTPNAKEEG